MTLRFALFLALAVAVVAVVGRLRRAHGAAPPKPIQAAQKCPTCGTYILDGQACRCENRSPRGTVGR